MTFYEAAVEVLREAGRPLHFKKITEISIRRELLSHVGKTPEITMGARLEIEAAKPVTETLLVRVRPGVYSLREGADVAEAVQTIRPRGYVELPEEEGDDNEELEAASAETASVVAASPSEAAVGDEGDDDEAAADGDEGAADNGEANARRRRRRGRRGGRGRAKENGEAETEAGEAGPEAVAETIPKSHNHEASWAPADIDDDASATPTPKAAAPVQAAPKPAHTGRRPQPTADVATPKAPKPSRAPLPAPVFASAVALDGPGIPLALHEAGDIARAIVGILQASTERSLHARALASELASQKIAGLGKVGPAVLREHIEFANLRRTRLGRPPLFEEVRPNQWAVATASGSALAGSYSALDQWQDSHRDALRRTLHERLAAMSPEALTSIVGLTLDRLGYRQIAVYDPFGDELMTLAANTPRALTGSRIAVRIARPEQVAGRQQVAALRGALHSFAATEGAYIALGGFEAAAHSEATVPNVAPIALIDADRLVDHMLAASVGVTTFHVDVHCIDESLFRDLPGAQ